MPEHAPAVGANESVSCALSVARPFRREEHSLVVSSFEITQHVSGACDPCGITHDRFRGENLPHLADELRYQFLSALNLFPLIQKFVVAQIVRGFLLSLHWLRSGR